MNPDDFRVRAAQAQALLEAMGLPDSQPVLKIPPPIETFISPVQDAAGIDLLAATESASAPVEYDGAKVSGMPHGSGSGRFADGGMYVGEWVNGLRHGKGVHSFASGSVYDGEWLVGKRHGKGSMQYASGSKYSGAWEDDLKHGMGLYRHQDQSVYSGRWVRGLMDGTGEYKWPEGGAFTTFVGQFRLRKALHPAMLRPHTMRRNSKKEGPGVLSFPDERNWRGIWKMDEPVGVGVWRKKDQNGNWISEKSEFDPEASKRRADHLDHFLKLPSFQQRYELEVKSRDSVRDARKCADDAAGVAAAARAAADRALELSNRVFSSELK